MVRYFQSLAVVCCVALSWGNVVEGQGAKFKLDPTHTSVIFGVSHLSLSYTYGRFNTVDGEFTFDGANPETATFRFEIDANTIDTNNAKRDEHLRGADFFNVKQFPKLEFVSSRVEKTEEGVNVFGKMTMHGETQEIMIPFKKLGEGDSPFGDYRVGFYTQFNLQRSKFGMNNMLQGIGDEIAITFSFEGIRQ